MLMSSASLRCLLYAQLHGIFINLIKLETIHQMDVVLRVTVLHFGTFIWPYMVISLILVKIYELMRKLCLLFTDIDVDRNMQ